MVESELQPECLISAPLAIEKELNWPSSQFPKAVESSLALTIVSERLNIKVNV